MWVYAIVPCACCQVPAAEGRFPTMDIALRIKSSLVGTPVEGIAITARSVLDFRRFRHPELAELRAEGAWISKALAKLLSRSSNCVDVGCHIGSFLSSVISIAPNGAHVAFEPVPEKAKFLRSKFSSARIVQAAVADVRGLTQFHVNKSKPGYSRISATGEITVPVTTIDDEITGAVDLLKIDVEGGELDVLKGAEKTLSKNRPVILFECGAESDLPNGYRKDLFNHLSAAGYQILTPCDFVFDKRAMGYEEFLRCGLYPFRAFNFIATPN